MTKTAFLFTSNPATVDDYFSVVTLPDDPCLGWIHDQLKCGTFQEAQASVLFGAAAKGLDAIWCDETGLFSAAEGNGTVSLWRATERGNTAIYQIVGNVLLLGQTPGWQRRAVPEMRLEEFKSRFIGCLDQLSSQVAARKTLDAGPTIIGF